MILILIIGLLFATVAVIFAVQNTAPITVTFLFWQIEGSLALVLLAAFALGVISTILVSLPGLIRRSAANAGHRRQIGALEKEVDGLKKEISALQQANEALKPKPTPSTPPQQPPSAPPANAVETPAPDEPKAP